MSAAWPGNPAREPVARESGTPGDASQYLENLVACREPNRMPGRLVAQRTINATLAPTVTKAATAHKASLTTD